MNDTEPMAPAIVVEGSYLLSTSDPDPEFDRVVKYLNWLAHEINDIGAVAANLIAERRRKYNFIFEQNKLFLKDYALDHLKRDKDGQIKGKSYKRVTAGGGVFFRAKPQRIIMDDELLPKLRSFVAQYAPDMINLIEEKTVLSVADPETLLDTLKAIAETKAKEVFTDPEQITVGAVAALEEIIHDFGIEIEEADTFHHMHVGSVKANSFTRVKTSLTQAIDGHGRADEEEEVNLLIEELG